MKKYAFIFLIIVIMIIVTVSLAETNRTLSFDAEEYVVYLGKRVQIKPTVTKVTDDAPWQTTLLWNSSDESIAIVDAYGNINPVAAGTAIITATASDDEQISLAVSVEVRVPVSIVTVEPEQANLLVGAAEDDAKVSLKYIILPEDAFHQDVTWTSSNEAVATVDDNGLVTAVGKGHTNISVKSDDPTMERPATCKINVAQAVTGISLDQKSINIPVNKNITIKATVEPDDAGNKKLEWASSNENIVTINANGSLKAIAEGDAIITCKTTDGSAIETSCSVTVVQPVKKISFSEKDVILAPGTYHQIESLVEPDNATMPTLNWTSSNEDVAIVDESGTVTGIGKGKANIVAMATDGSGVKASILVKVEDFDLVFTSKRPQNIKFSYTGGMNFSVKASVKNGNVSIPDIDTYIQWMSGGTQKETVEVTPVHAGTDVITIKVGNSKANYNVYVADYFEEYEIQYVELPDTSAKPENGSFRDIVYGSSYADVKEKLVNDYGNNYQMSDHGTGFEIKFINPPTMVAGHEVKHIKLSFCYDIDHNGTIVTDEDKTCFYYGEYYFSNVADDAISKNLYNKLCELYGPTERKFEDSSSHIWYDDDKSIELNNSTEVKLKYTWLPGRSKAYQLREIISYLQELKKQKEKDAEQEQFDSTTDGL